MLVRNAAVAGLILSTLTGCGAGEGNQPGAQKSEESARNTKPSTTHTITYQVESATKGRYISYIDQNNKVQEMHSPSLPWSTTFEIDEARVHYLAFNADVEYAPSNEAGLPRVRCRLIVDGEVVDERDQPMGVECSTDLALKN